MLHTIVLPCSTPLPLVLLPPAGARASSSRCCSPGRAQGNILCHAVLYYSVTPHAMLQTILYNIVIMYAAILYNAMYMAYNITHTAYYAICTRYYIPYAA